MAMSNSTSKRDYLKERSKGYLLLGKKDKTRILDEAVSFTGYNRKYLSTWLNNVPYQRKRQIKGGRPKEYADTAFIRTLTMCWRTANEICPERLVPFLPELIDKLTLCGELETSDEVISKLKTVSISTVRRLLDGRKRFSIVPVSTTKPGSLLKSQIKVRRGRWDTNEPGWLESDTVAHCGMVNEGEYINSYNFIDIMSGWSEQIGAMGKGERLTIVAIEEVESVLPFRILGIDSDNGSEYINGHILRYCRARDIVFTRSRPYQKNDNAHVEQKNWEAIRKIVGYHRLDTEQQLAILNKLYRGPLRLYLNYFQPTRKRKRLSYDPVTGKSTKAYFDAKTPYQRLMESPRLDNTQKAMLKSEYNKLNPVKLLAEIKQILDELERTL